jgi:hypothetical protein
MTQNLTMDKSREISALEITGKYIGGLEDYYQLIARAQGV